MSGVMVPQKSQKHMENLMAARFTGSERVKVQSDTEKAWLVAYLPNNVVSADDAWLALEAIAGEAGAEVERF